MCYLVLTWQGLMERFKEFEKMFKEALTERNSVVVHKR